MDSGGRVGRVKRAGSVPALVVTWLWCCVPTVLAYASARPRAMPSDWPAITAADWIVALLVAYGLVYGLLRLLDAGRDRTWPAFRGAVAAGAAALVAVNALAGFVAAGAGPSPGEAAATTSGMLVSLLSPGLPCLVLRLRRYPPRAFSRRRYESAPGRAGRAPHAALPPPPRHGAPPLPGQVWEAYFPFEDRPGGKRRPCLIVAAGPRGLRALKITSQDKSRLPGYYAEISSARWRVMNGPGKRSWVEYGNPRTVPYADVHRPLGLCEPQPLWNAVARRYGLPPAPRAQRAGGRRTHGARSG
ncbi:hypothetical protein AB0I49_26000 [Streptomyces sp. NPDC050617]|uniref:hypothetical protein n=1 Tax=Streptomyces sp. NPDC050617 TaxID=3154628 RepID=UPI003434B08A